MGRMYDRKKHLAIRVLLRYDMLRGWKMAAPSAGTYRESAMAVASVPAAGGDDVAPPPGEIPGAEPERFPHRRARMPNVMATLIAAPEGGFSTHGVRERMKHHVTDLDGWLVLKDEEVARWWDRMLVAKTSQVVLQWQWLRRNNEIMEEMENGGWEELEGRADECEWVADDGKKAAVGKRDTKNRNGGEVEDEI